MTFEPGDSVWVKLYASRFCHWWPGKVIDPRSVKRRHVGRKKLVAAVNFLSDNSVTFVTDEANILPFETCEKEWFVKHGRELRCKPQRHRFSFDYDVCRVVRKPSSERRASFAHPPAMLRTGFRGRYMSEPSPRKLYSPSRAKALSPRASTGRPLSKKTSTVCSLPSPPERVRASSPTVDELCRPTPPARLPKKSTVSSREHLAVDSTRRSLRRSADHHTKSPHRSADHHTKSPCRSADHQTRRSPRRSADHHTKSPSRSVDHHTKSPSRSVDHQTKSPRRSAEQQPSTSTSTRSSLPAVSEYTTPSTVAKRRQSSPMPSTVVAKRRRSSNDLLLVAATISIHPTASTKGRRSLDQSVDVCSDDVSLAALKIALSRRSTRGSLDEPCPVATTTRSLPKRSTAIAGRSSIREWCSPRKRSSLAQSTDGITRRLFAVEAPSATTTSEVPTVITDMSCSQEPSSVTAMNDMCYEPVPSMRKTSRRLKTASVGSPSDHLVPATNGLCSTDQSMVTSVESSGVSTATTSKQSTQSTVAASKRLAARPAFTRSKRTPSTSPSGVAKKAKTMSKCLTAQSAPTLSKRSTAMSSSIVDQTGKTTSECLTAQSAFTHSNRSTSTSPPVVVRKAKTGRKRGSLSSDAADENEKTNATTQSVPSVSPNCSDDTDDDDLPQMTLNSGVQGPIVVGDLLWLKVRNYPFWPAVVKHVYHRKNGPHRLCKISSYFIGETSDVSHRGRAFSMTVTNKCVIPFGANLLQHSELKNAGMQSQYADDFCKAVKKAEDFIVQWAVEKTVTSLEFFSDEIGSGSTSGTCVPDTWSPEAIEMNFDTSSVSSDCRTAASESLDDNDDSDSTEGSTVSDTQRRRTERRRQFSRKLIDVIKSGQSKKHLEAIWTGALKCSRHDQFTMKMTLSQRQQMIIKSHAHGGPIEDGDQMDELVLIVADFYQSAVPDFNLSYVIDVLVPEAIVYALQRVRHLSNTEAEKRYKQKIRWTKEEMTIAGEDLMRNACNIAPEDKLIYRAKVDRLAKRLSL